MALQHIRECRVNILGERVILSGVDKKTEDKITLYLELDDYVGWTSGIPARYSFPDLSEEERRFLETGTKKQTNN